MDSTSRPPLIWRVWLTIASVGVVAFGLVLVAAPELTRQGFSLLLYSEPDAISYFGTEPTKYIALAHAVLGSVMVGWGVALIIVVRYQFDQGTWLGWQIIAWSVAAWFVPDTIFSLWSGFWQNAILNVAFGVLFLVPLIATYKAFRGSGA